MSLRVFESGANGDEERRELMNLWIELALPLACVVIGARIGGFGLGVTPGIGLLPVAFRVIGNPFRITLAVRSGQLQLNAREPLARFALMESQELLTTTAHTFGEKRVDGIVADTVVLERDLRETVGIVTGLDPARYPEPSDRSK